jgi:glycerophosphoryl diester phosphodiesterase
MAVAPENTLASFRQASDDGADWIEFDVRLSADGIPIIFHDDTLERTSDGVGPVAGHDLTALRALDAGHWFSPKFEGQMVPTFHETITLCQQLGLGMNIEIKPNPGEERTTAVAVLAMLDTRLGREELDFSRSILFSSFKIDTLETLRDDGPQWPRGLLISEWRPDWRRQAIALGCVSLHPRNNLLDSKETVRSIKEEGLLVFPYTINDPVRAADLFDWGVDAIITDDPRLMVSEIP